MEHCAYPAFGYYVVRNKIAAGEVITDDVFVDGLVDITVPFNICWFYTKGLVHNVNVSTGAVSVRTPGFCNAVTKETAGVWRADFLEESVVFCVPPQQPNPSVPPLVDLLVPLVLPAGQSTTIQQGTKLYVCQGLLTVGDKTVPSLRQLEFKNGSRTVTAVEDCFCLIFP
jgi:hypothetical protein